MKSCKTVIIDRNGLIKMFLPLLVGIILIAVMIFNVCMADKYASAEEQIRRHLGFVEESLPLIYGLQSKERDIKSEIREIINKGVEFILGYDTKMPGTVFSGEIPVIKVVNSGYLVTEANKMAKNKSRTEIQPKEEPRNESEGQRYPIREVDSAQGKTADKTTKILIRNDTKYSINIDEMLNSQLKLNVSGEGPKILIVHTHATEGYSPEGENTYLSNQSDRNMDEEKNVIKVGKAMKNVFEEKGISVIHDTTLHDYPDFNGSYGNSAKTVEKYLKKYPGICIVFDVHRDAFVYEDGSKAKFVTDINGIKTAQLMFVVGTDGGGLYHPEWRENMKFALQLQNHIASKYPQLMRGVNLRTERFNGHTTHGSVIIEVGSSGNTMSEAVAGAEIAAAEIADFLNKKSGEE